MEFPGRDGFLGTRATFMLDLVSLAMVIVVVVLAWSIIQVRRHHRYQLHKYVQTTLGIVLLIVLIVFEVDVRMHGWQERAAGELGGRTSSGVLTALSVHLCFAVTTVVLWIVVIARAWRQFPNPPIPNSHSAFHRRWARIAAWDMVFTAISGWIFYVMAFVV